MADIKSAEQRSKNMSRIRGIDTEPEVWLRKRLFSKGIRYRKNEKDLPGSPDLWITKYNTAVFVHGCFWHRHKDCRFAYTPKSNVEFWKSKFEANIARDARVCSELLEKNVRVLIVWECTVKRMKHSEKERENVIQRILFFLSSEGTMLEI